ncbi:MAG: cupin domain-containing protein [Ferruginibacter sp.]
MKKHIFLSMSGACLLLICIGFSKVFAGHQQKGYILEHEKDLAINQPGPHDGGGSTTAIGYFSKATNCNIVFRKRILHPGSSIGYHLQKSNEIYYIISGAGEMKMNGETLPVKGGDAILTLPGSSHGLTPTGNEDLVVIINYEKKSL